MKMRNASERDFETARIILIGLAIVGMIVASL